MDPKSGFQFLGPMLWANCGFPHIFCTKRLANRIRSLYVTGLGQRCFPQRPADQAPVAQLDRAPDYESGGQRFESFRARHFFQRLKAYRLEACFPEIRIGKHMGSREAKPAAIPCLLFLIGRQQWQ
jgi:hypothetical protein